MIVGQLRSASSAVAQAKSFGAVRPAHGQDAGSEAARHGIAVLNLPFTAPTLTPEHVAIFAEALSRADGKILAFCRTGNRSSMLWAAANVALGAPLGAVLEQAADAGFDLKPAAAFIRDLGNSAVIE